jgi:hypothetical protein
MVDQENEMPCRRIFAAESKGGAPSKGLGAQRPEGKALGVLTSSQANNVGGRKRISMAISFCSEIAKKARHSMFPDGTRRALPSLLP